MIEVVNIYQMSFSIFSKNVELDQNFLKECGIIPEFTAAYSPQQNGVSERLNRTLVEAAT